VQRATGEIIERRAEMAKAKDPICGMDVEVKPDALQATYQGTTYYFCGPGCKQTFDADPKTYARA
jgi:Cu+-exporting ATPase